MKSIEIFNVGTQMKHNFIFLLAHNKNNRVTLDESTIMEDFWVTKKNPHKIARRETIW